MLRFVGPQQFLAPDHRSLITTHLCGCDEEGDAGLPSLLPLHLSTARRGTLREMLRESAQECEKISTTHKQIKTFAKFFLQPPHKESKDKLLRQLPWF